MEAEELKRKLNESLNNPSEEEKQRQKEWVKKMVSEIDEDSRKELIWKRLEKYKKKDDKSIL